MVMTVENDRTVLIKAPKWVRKSDIQHFYEANKDWIRSQKQKLAAEKDKIVYLSERDVADIKKQAKIILSRKTDYYAALMGLKPEYIKITSAAKRWGSCHKKGDKYSVCYSFRTVFLPDRVQDYIVVHELAHMVHFNHSKEFYRLIEKYLPDRKSLMARADSFKDYHIY